MIEYQESSVVSRTLIDEEVGTVTLFAFDQGQGLSEHTTPYAAMVHILEGEAKVTISGKPLMVKQGEMTIMPAN
jgi:quercetin dioxygenase-like cupin family protein